METIAASMDGSLSDSFGSSLASSDYKSTLNGESVTFERNSSGELCLLGKGKFGKVGSGSCAWVCWNATYTPKSTQDYLEPL